MSLSMYPKKEFFLHNLSQLSIEGFSWEVIDNSHSNFILKWRNNPNNLKFFDNQKVLTLNDQIDFLNNYNKLDRIDLILKKEDIPIGVFNIKNLGTMPDYGALIGDELYRGKGIGLLAKNSILDYWFNVLDETIIYVKNKRINKKVIESNLRLGFGFYDEDDEYVILSLDKETYNTSK